MRIDKNSKLYKIGVVVVLILLVAYYIYTWNAGDSGEYGDDATTTVADTNNDNSTTASAGEDEEEPKYRFYSQSLLEQHYEKHGIEMGFESSEEYEAAASKVVTNKNSLHKIEEEDGDDVYYLEETNEFVIVSTSGYIRTYFYPSDGLDYFNRQ